MASVARLLWGISLLLAVTWQGALASWWMDEPYGSDDYNTQQLYTENVTLECRDERVPSSFQVEYWFRPDLTVMKAGDSEYFWTLDGYAGWQVSADGRQMHVSVLQEEQFGFYHCVIYSAPDYYVVKKAINYKGPYFGDLWPKYRMNTIIGCSAAGGFLVLALVAGLIYHFRFQDDQDNDDDSSSRSSVSSSATSGQSPSTSSGSHGEWSPGHDGKARHRKVAPVGHEVKVESQEIPEHKIAYVNVGFGNEEVDTHF